MKKKRSSTSFARLASSLSEFITSLPTDDQRLQFAADLRSVISALTEIERLVSTLPTDAAKSHIENALSALNRLGQTAKASPPLSLLVGLPVSRVRKTAAPITDDEASNAKKLM